MRAGKDGLAAPYQACDKVECAQFEDQPGHPLKKQVKEKLPFPQIATQVRPSLLGGNGPSGEVRSDQAASAVSVGKGRMDKEAQTLARDSRGYAIIHPILKQLQ